MSLSRYMKQGDLEPPFDPVLYDDDGVTPLNLSAATSVKVTCYQNGASVFTSRAATGDAQGRVNMPWVAGDTNTIGTLRLEVEIEWSAGRIQTVPSEDTFYVYVTADLV